MVNEKFLDYLDEVTSKPIRKSRADLELLLSEKATVERFKNEIILWLGRPDQYISETIRNFIYMHEDMHIVQSPNLPSIEYYGNSNKFINAIVSEKLYAEEIGVVFHSLITTGDSSKETDKKAAQLAVNSGVVQALRQRLIPGELTLLDSILFLSSKELEKKSAYIINNLKLDDETTIKYVIPKGEWQENDLVHFLENTKSKYPKDYMHVFLFSDKFSTAIYENKNFGISNFYKRSSVQEWADENGIQLDLKLQYEKYIGFLGGEPKLPFIAKNNWPHVEKRGILVPLNFYGSVNIDEVQFDLFAGVDDDTEDEDAYLVKNGLNAVITKDSFPSWVVFQPLEKDLQLRPVLKIPYIKKTNPKSTKFLESAQIKKLQPVYTFDPEALDEKYYNWGDGEDLVIFWDPKNSYYCLTPTLY